jgi:uncharacterized protein DUF11/prealbumin domain-containing protein
VWFGIALLVAVLGVLAAFLQPALSQSNEKKVRICHATSAETNPYVVQEPAIANNGDLEGGHLDHKGPVFPAVDWGDIIPPYTYVDENGVTQTFPGYNWSPEGQAIWQNGCEPGLDPLNPVVECVEPGPAGGFLAHFGYDNPNNQSIDLPYENYFEPLSKDGLQPTTFDPGRHVDVFQVHSDGGPLTWHLSGNQATASTDSTHCQGSITIIKILNPKTDPGRFNLEIDGSTAGGASGVGDGGNTGSIAVDSGTHTVGESAANGTNLSDYDVQITCATSTTIVAEGIGHSLRVPVTPRQAVVCAITNTHKPANTITPTLECVVTQGGAPVTAVWGYSNPNSFPVRIPIGATNGFAPAPVNRGQPIVFDPGNLVGAFQTQFAGATTLAWRVGNKTVTASAGSTRCTATLELRKVTVPANDPGLFNLQVNGQLWAVGGNGTTTGPVTVGVGEGTVSETAGPGTDLANYDSTVECSRNGAVEVSVPGTKVDGAVAQGDVVVCTFTNTRKSTAPSPGPQPPQPPQPPLPPLPPPPVPLGDLSVTKTASPTTAIVGHIITWTVKVTNHSTLAAADVDVVRVSELSYRVKVLSITPSLGSCSLSGCNLGRLAPGASATITVVTRATAVGRVLNVVHVNSEEQESNYLNNTAAALVRITADPKNVAARAVRAAALSRACRTLVATPRVLQSGGTSIVLTTARNRFGRPIRGLLVNAFGLGLDQRARTDARGVARFSVTPTQHGIVHFRHASRSPANVRSNCGTFLAVLGTTIQRPVTG